MLRCLCVGPGAIVVDDPMNPDSPNIAQRTVCEDRGIFDRDAFLVIETIRDPPANCVARKGAAIHRQMKGMLVVIGADPDFLQACLKSLTIPCVARHT
jgi:hypothetical protein